MPFRIRRLDNNNLYRTIGCDNFYGRWVVIPLDVLGGKYCAFFMLVHMKTLLYDTLDPYNEATMVVMIAYRLLNSTPTCTISGEVSEAVLSGVTIKLGSAGQQQTRAEITAFRVLQTADTP
jgi:hypothetical protein